MHTYKSINTIICTKKGKEVRIMANKNLCRIGSRLEVKHLTQEQLAELLGLSVGFIGMVECGKRVPSLATFLDMISVLEVTADNILCDAVDYVSSSRLAEYDSEIKNLSKAERERFFKMLDVFFEKD